jgi:hypothetical protein
MREQEQWDEHAAFMNRHAEDGFVVPGGPLGAEAKFLLIVAAESEQAIVARLAEDPWTPKGLLRIAASSAGRSYLAASGRVCLGRL